MAEQTTDVKQGADSSPVQKPDVKQTFDQAASAMVDAIVSGTSTEKNEEEEKSPVLEKNKTKEKENVEEAEKTDLDEKETEEEKTDEKEESTEEEGQKEEEETKGEETEKVDEKSPKTEESIPYARFKEVNDKATRFEGLAKDQESLVSFCQQNNITADTFRDGLTTLALIQSDPKAALAKLEPLVKELQIATGNGLPNDLQKEVDDSRKELEDGTISERAFKVIEASAKERAQLRGSRASMENQNRFSQLQQQQREAQEVTGALASWASNKKQLDPTFKPKADPNGPDGKFEDFLAKNVYLWTMNPPKNSQEALALADKALAEVNTMAQRYQPKPKARKAPLSSNGNRSSESGEPKTQQEVVNRIARKHGFNI